MRSSFPSDRCFRSRVDDVRTAHRPAHSLSSSTVPKKKVSNHLLRLDKITREYLVFHLLLQRLDGNFQESSSLSGDQLGFHFLHGLGRFKADEQLFTRVGGNGLVRLIWFRPEDVFLSNHHTLMERYFHLFHNWKSFFLP